MKLIDLQVNEYLEVLRSDAPAPGGGSVSALAGAQAVGLFMMVADLTLGKEKYADYQDVCETAKQRGAVLYNALTKAIDKDTDAFNLVSNAFQMPKGTDEEKAARSKAIAEGTLAATEVPYSVMQYAYDGMLLAKAMVGKSNPNAASDLGVSVLNLMAAIKGAWLNVKINLPGVKDKEKAKAFEEGGQRIYDEAQIIARELYDEILEQL